MGRKRSKQREKESPVTVRLFVPLRKLVRLVFVARQRRRAASCESGRYTATLWLLPNSQRAFFLFPLRNRDELAEFSFCCVSTARAGKGTTRGSHVIRRTRGTDRCATTLLGCSNVYWGRSGWFFKYHNWFLVILMSNVNYCNARPLYS